MKKDVYGAPVLYEKDRSRQIRKEAAVSLGLYGAFFIWWYFTGYGLGSGDPKTIPMCWPAAVGLLELHCRICGFCAATIIVVKKLFKNFSLEETLDDEPDPADTTEGGQENEQI